MWPYEDKFTEYIDRCGEVYSKSLESAGCDVDHPGCASSRPWAATCAVK